jgi:hypothetical protein
VTNGMFLIPQEYTIGTTDDYNATLYSWWTQWVYTNGDLSIAGNDYADFTLTAGISYDYGNYEWMMKPYFDGLQQLKQNMVFLLRAGMVNYPFEFTD